MSIPQEDNITWQVTTSEDPETGDIILPIPEELLKRLGWKEGDVLDWQQSTTGSWILTKK